VQVDQLAHRWSELTMARAPSDLPSPLQLTHSICRVSMTTLRGLMGHSISPVYGQLLSVNLQLYSFCPCVYDFTYILYLVNTSSIWRVYTSFVHKISSSETTVACLLTNTRPTSNDCNHSLFVVVKHTGQPFEDIIKTLCLIVYVSLISPTCLSINNTTCPQERTNYTA